MRTAKAQVQEHNAVRTPTPQAFFTPHLHCATGEEIWRGRFGVEGSQSEFILRLSTDAAGLACRPMLYTPDDLDPVYESLSQTVSNRLPPDIARRLVWSRNSFRHGSKTDMILFNAWDSHQTGLERNQFNYCLNYKPKRPEADGCIWLLQVRCNVQRIAKVYPKVRNALRFQLRRLKKVCPAPFVYREDEQTVELRFTFNFDRALKSFPGFVAPKFQTLIEAAHPILIEAIDLFHRDAPPVSIASIGPLPKRHREIQKDLSIYAGWLSAAMKVEILDRYDHSCARCAKPVKKGDLEFHHLIFKSKGGLRKIENFAPLHLVCHDDLHRVADENGKLPPNFLRQPHTDK